MAPTAANTIEASKNWILSWYPEGRSDSFTRDAILTCAPPTSGVYGLFNSDCQVFIGESDNIQEALLRHESETEFHSRHLQPTGFTFETCDEELRKSKMAELIAKYRPVMQTEAALTEPYLLSDEVILNDPESVDGTSQDGGGPQQFPEDERDQAAQARPPVKIRRTLAVALGVAVMVGAGIFYFDIPVDVPYHMESDSSKVASVQTTTPIKVQKLAPTTRADGSAIKNVRNNTKSPDDVRSTPPANAAPAGGAKKNVDAIRAVNHATVESTLHSPVNGINSSKNWSVQVAAAPTQDIADALLQKLKASGFEGYVVPAEVNGKNYFRVRVGPFDGQQEAESTRQALTRLGSYRDAYLAKD